MDIESLTKHIELEPYFITDGPSLGSARPGGELIVTAKTYDQETPGVNGQLFGVMPAVVATGGTIGGRQWGPSGLRLGVVTLLSFEAYAEELTPLTATVETSGSTSYYHQLTEQEIGEHSEFPDLFEGARVYWGDGQSTNISSALESVTHTYATAGTYDVRLEFHFADDSNFAWSGHPSAARRIAVD